MATGNSFAPHGGPEIDVRRGRVQCHGAIALQEIIDTSEHDAVPVQVGARQPYATTLLRNVKDKTCAMAALRSRKIIFVHRVEPRETGSTHCLPCIRVLRAAGYRRMTRSPLDQSGGRYGGALTILEFFAEPCGAHMRLMRQCLDFRPRSWRTLRMFQPTSCLTSMHSRRPTCQSMATVGLPTIR